MKRFMWLRLCERQLHKEGHSKIPVKVVVIPRKGKQRPYVTTRYKAIQTKETPLRLKNVSATRGGYLFVRDRFVKNKTVQEDHPVLFALHTILTHAEMEQPLKIRL